ncbi:hypothetical protein D5S18_19590 [Nocardia panacis]|uniref:Uncharacterized protein n=1 Tax=Nocardia panacis TaxID=2340916 RepID=A0A3A4KG58_9NOCA|nr:hypothetical protein D5S18_19590 [Nocardia panacis]
MFIRTSPSSRIRYHRIRFGVPRSETAGYRTEFGAGSDIGVRSRIDCNDASVARTARCPAQRDIREL